MYIGTLIQHKEATASIKLKKKRAVPQEEQIVVYNSHEPIIETAVFDLARELNAKKAVTAQNSKPVAHVLSGSIYCGICGARLTFSKVTGGTRRNEFSVVCSRYKRFSQCERLAVYERDLEEIVLSSLKALPVTAAERSGLLAGVAGVSVADERTGTGFMRKQLVSLRNRVEDINHSLKSLYIDKARGVVSEDLFCELSAGLAKDRAELESSIGGLEQRLNALEAARPRDGFNDVLSDVLHDIVGFNILTRQMLMALVERIEVHRNKKIVIKYKFKERPASCTQI